MSAHLNAAQTRANGWQVLPLPRNAKYPPPAGYTGKDGNTASLDVAPGHNFAIRLPEDVIAIDVDHGYPSAVDGREKHGADTMMALIARLGALPETYTLSSRADRRSRQGFYRVPGGTVLLGELPGSFGPDGQHSDVEILQHHHRYAVGPGSTLDGREYTLRGPGGAPMQFMPPPDVLPMLPAAWVRALSSNTIQRAVPAGQQPTAPVPARRLTFEEASDFYARAVLAYGQATAPGFNAKLFKFLSVSKAYWLAQGLTDEQWFDTAENEVAAHPYYQAGGPWAGGLDTADVRVIGEALSRSQIVWEIVDPEPVNDLPLDAQPGEYEIYIITEPWDCGAGADDPTRVVRAWLKLTNQRIHHWRGKYFRYSAGRWKHWEDGELGAIIQRDLELSFYVKDIRGNRVDTPFKPTPDKVTAFLKTLAWHTNRQDHWTTDASLVFENGVLDLTTGQLSPHTAKLFNLHKIRAPYDPAAEAPNWLAFIAASLPDPDQRDVLQEVMGYLISGRGDLQKIFGLWGEPRSGKSTIGKVLAEIIGEGTGGLTASNFSDFVGPFGLQQHTESSVILINEARTTKENKGAVQTFLSISGQDKVSVNVKNKQPQSLTLPGRLVMMSNGLPNVMDNSEAFASRFIHLLFTVSFSSNPDLTLFTRLQGELPGIVAWALRGLERLNTNGGLFTVSAQHAAAGRVLEISSANMPTWFKDCVVVTREPSDRLTASALMASYERWCAQHEIDEKHVSNAHQLGAWLTTKLGVGTVAARYPNGVFKARVGLKFAEESHSNQSEPKGILE